MYTTVPSPGKKMAKPHLLQLKNVEEEVSTIHERGQKKKFKTCLQANFCKSMTYLSCIDISYMIK